MWMTRRIFRIRSVYLTVIRTASGTRQKWSMVEEAVKSFNITPPFAIIKNEDKKRLKQFCSWRAPAVVHFSLYRALELSFPLDVTALTIGGHIKTEMNQGSMGETVGIITPTMFKADG